MHTYIYAFLICRASPMSCNIIHILVFWMTSLGSFLGLWSTQCSTYSASLSLVPVVMHVAYTPLYLCSMCLLGCLLLSVSALCTVNPFKFLSPPSHWLPSSLHMPYISMHVCTYVHTKFGFELRCHFWFIITLEVIEKVK